jgi:hypothetical protein
LLKKTCIVFDADLCGGKHSQCNVAVSTRHPICELTCCTPQQNRPRSTARNSQRSGKYKITGAPQRAFVIGHHIQVEYRRTTFRSLMRLNIKEPALDASAPR